MVEASWKYANGNQILFDGTFGVCLRRILLFIVMAINKDRRGVSLSFFIFSARSRAQATHASYDTDILYRLITVWQKHLEGGVSKSFVPWVVITENDTCEQLALMQVWPGITLLLCKFHLHQSWKNYQTRVFGTGKLNSGFHMQHVHNQIRDLEIELVQSTLHLMALEILDAKLAYISSTISHESNKAALAGTKHLMYLKNEWMPYALWSSWSDYG